MTGVVLRPALRGWRRRPLPGLAIVATLALGIGANSAVFTLVTLKTIGLYQDHPVTLFHGSGGAEPERIPAAATDSALFAALAVEPLSSPAIRWPSQRRSRY